MPMVRGNVPQFMYTGHTANRIFGTGKNPYDESRTVSGSSGGDAGMVAARCVPFALGTDIGGSVRGPAHANGIVGFKPTSHRSSTRGQVNCAKGYSMPQNVVLTAAGPLCLTVDDVKRYCECLWSEAFLKQN